MKVTLETEGKEAPVCPAGGPRACNERHRRRLPAPGRGAATPVSSTCTSLYLRNEAALCCTACARPRIETCNAMDPSQHQPCLSLPYFPAYEPCSALLVAQREDYPTGRARDVHQPPQGAGVPSLKQADQKPEQNPDPNQSGAMERWGEMRQRDRDEVPCAPPSQ